MKKIAIVVLGLAFVAAACNKTNPEPISTSTNNTSTPTPTITTTPLATPTPIPTPTPTANQNTSMIHITSTGFSPNTLTIKKGTTVTFINDDTNPHWPASNPHPVHTDYSGFDSKKSIDAGGSWSFTFNNAGTWQFHDHLRASIHGAITVQ